MRENGVEQNEDRFDRRYFLHAIAAGTAGMAGCLSGGDAPSRGGTGSERGSGPSPRTGSESGPSPGAGDPFVSDDADPFLLPAGEVDTTFDVDLTSETVLLEDDDLTALETYDLETHRYTFDADRLQSSGLDLSEGSVLWISGLALRRVSTVEERGSTLVVDTEFASLDEAISDGTVGWDADLGFTSSYASEQFDRVAAEESVLGSSNSLGVSPASSAVALADVAVTNRAGEVVGRPTFQRMQNGEDQEVLQLEFTQGTTDYVFGLTPMGDEIRLKAEMTSPSGSEANLRFTGIGTAKAVRATGQVEYGDGELTAMDVEANQLEGEIEIDIAAAGSGVEEETEIPLPGGFMFRHIFMVGAIPITVTTSIELKAKINVVSNASATATSRFSFGGDTGFVYDGTEVVPEATIGTLKIDPESADSGAYFGQPVHAGFGVVFPRVSISVFDQLLIPYVKVGMALNTSLSWGPVCKRSYIQLIVQAGYDLTILGVNLAAHETTLAEETTEGDQEGCE